MLYSILKKMPNPPEKHLRGHLVKYIRALICFSHNVYFEPNDIKNLIASNGQSVIVCGIIIFFEFVQF